MVTYLIRRILLFFPTLLGATLLVFFVVALAPGGITATALTTEGNMRPEARKAREDAMNERYGLYKPLYIQYLRWLNRISPVRFAPWLRTDAEVIAAAALEAEAEAPLIARVKLLSSQKDRLDAAAQQDQVRRIASEISDLNAKMRAIDFAPNAGDVRFSKPTVGYPDLGESMAKGRSVGPLIWESVQITILLQIVAIPLSYLIAVFTGVMAARHRGTWIDATSGTLAIALWSLPSIWVVVLLIGYLANDNYINIFPPQGLNHIQADAFNFLPTWTSEGFQRGFLLDRIWHLILPIICLSYSNVAFLQKLTRGALLENIASDFVRTARAKGLSEGVVLWAHAFRNSLIPLITVAAYLLPSLISGSIIVESAFGINGMGKLTIEAITSRDRELFLSNTLIIVLLGMIGTLLADLLNVIADPRVSYDG
jgi:ABC-type dipeptide/oligopeptide/nickel transport system permease component